MSAVFYTIMWPSFRNAALDLGWTLALHGSMANDMDIMAMPWIEDAKPVEDLIKALSDCIGHTIWKDHHFKPGFDKPNGRKVYTLSIFTDFYIDLSVIGHFSEVKTELTKLETALCDDIFFCKNQKHVKKLTSIKNEVTRISGLLP